MMGKSHALSGAVGWLSGAAVVSSLGATPQPAAVWAGAAVSAGMALLPDLDHPGSTVSRTLGPVTRFIAGRVVWIAGRSQRASCEHCRRDSNAGGHRGLTHTAAGAAATGLLVACGVLLLGHRFALVVSAFAVWLLAHSALSSKVRAQVGDMLLPGRFRFISKAAFRVAGAVGAILVGLLAAGLLHDTTVGWWWLGPAVGWGCLAHSLGDAMTYSRVPLLWPLRIGGCRWARVGMPRGLRFRTGSWVEKAVVAAMFGCGLLSLWVMGGRS